MSSVPNIRNIIFTTELYCNSHHHCSKYDNYFPQVNNLLTFPFFNFPVPQPTVEVSTFPESGPFYAGSDLSLRCLFEINSAVDIPYTVTVDWLKSGAVLSGDDRVFVSNVTQLSSNLYLTSVDLNPLSSSSDTGTYTCRVTADANPPLLHIQRAVHSVTNTITVQSK